MKLSSDVAVNAASRVCQGACRVVFIGNSGTTTLNFRSYLIRSLVCAGFSVKILAPDWTASQIAQLRHIGAEGLTYSLARTGLNPVKDLVTLVMLHRYLRRERPAYVLTFMTKPNIWGTVAATLARVPRRVAMIEGLGYVFAESVSGGLNKRSLLRLIVTALYKVSMRCAHAVIVQNADDESFIQREFGVNRSKIIRVNGTGVPLDEWPMLPPHLSPITFTMVARVLREKGVLEFISAAQQLKVSYPCVRFCLLGGLDEENPGGLTPSALEALLQDGAVEWPGAVDVRPWLAQTSVFVLPSYREGLPRSTQEAMAMGRPVITTNVPGCRETVVDGVNGFLVPPRDTEALVKAMERFIVCPDLIEQMGKESRRIAEERFDAKQVNALIMRVLLSPA